MMLFILVLVVVVVVMLLVPRRYREYVIPLFGILIGGALGAAVGVQTTDGSLGGILACAAAGAVFLGALASS
jgi:hypothetical protein